MTPSESIYWELDKPRTGKGIAEWDASVHFGERVECPFTGQHGAGRWPETISVRLTSKKITDFIWTGLGDCIIQERVLQMFRKESFTGFEVTPVKARMKIRGGNPDICDNSSGVFAGDVRKIRIPPLWKMVIRGWGGLARPESGMRLIERCPACNRQKYSAFTDAAHLVDEKQWDGSDFFMIWPLPLHVFVTDRVAQFVLKEKLTGVTLTRLEELRWPEGIGQDCTPAGELRLWMPDDRARELGEPLGIY